VRVKIWGFQNSFGEQKVISKLFSKEGSKYNIVGKKVVACFQLWVMQM
jgi:hypothetical protein